MQPVADVEDIAAGVLGPQLSKGQLKARGTLSRHRPRRPSRTEASPGPFWMLAQAAGRDAIEAGDIAAAADEALAADEGAAAQGIGQIEA